MPFAFAMRPLSAALRRWGSRLAYTGPVLCRSMSLSHDGYPRRAKIILRRAEKAEESGGDGQQRASKIEQLLSGDSSVLVNSFPTRCRLITRRPPRRTGTSNSPKSLGTDPSVANASTLQLPKPRQETEPGRDLRICTSHLPPSHQSHWPLPILSFTA
ncbi:uncharacterized protein CC84DRAFT_1160830 [Paraphaeosphaeria sporulosa]|uniref:Uncharacterized protein n=1 Tax=Paraphaeosphaeria sporulosa TaxID=1460663 RepID=A0A177CR02_9PLEO|nr:uncharacterized protein CC84DRAFT_1160830 [Paraphaeosphaeria sporulosa]OAG09736.1 hypothetical protein CC84DRAFT_1160830 [Paraphaeosphaeria sporulosa]